MRSECYWPHSEIIKLLCVNAFKCRVSSSHSFNPAHVETWQSTAYIKAENWTVPKILDSQNSEPATQDAKRFSLHNGVHSGSEAHPVFHTLISEVPSRWGQGTGHEVGHFAIEILACTQQYMHRTSPTHTHTRTVRTTGRALRFSWGPDELSARYSNLPTEETRRKISAVIQFSSESARPSPSLSSN
jgi:hypothetical protein